MDSASKIFTVTFIIFIWGFTIVYGGLISKSPEKAKKISSYFNITIAILSVSAIFGPMLYEYFTK
jgi:hypothetical protein